MAKMVKPKGAAMEKPDAATAKRLLRYIFGGGYTGRFILTLFCIIIAVAASVASSLFLQILIDDYIIPLMGMENPVFSGLLKAIGLMCILYVAAIIATLVFNRTMVTISQGILKTIRDDMFAHMQTLPVKYFDTHSHGDIMSHYTNDTDTLRQFISQSLPQMVSSLLTIIAVFVTMIALSPLMTAVVVVVLVGMLVISGKVAGHSGRYFFRQQQSLGALNGYIEEMIHGQRVVKVFCHEEKAKEGFDEKNEELFKNAASANTFANILMPIMGNIGHFQYVLLAVVGGALAINDVGGLTLGIIASFLQLSRSVSNPVAQISQQLNSVVMALSGAKRIFRLLDEEPEEDHGYVTLVRVREENGDYVEDKNGIWAWKHPHHDGTLTYTPLAGDVRMFDVDFGYTPEKTVLHDITLYAKPGQKVAFVGATGAGKTTITNLINRFYDIEDGKVRYDGININKIKKPDLRRSLGMVLQDTFLFTGTVAENIRYGKLDATDEEVVNAAKLANAHGFISRLPEGYNTVISGSGEELSQGQRQLIAIARAAVADPPVMILDEATSSIDTHTEAIVQRGMDSLMKGRTVFVIAHRLSTVQNSDVIMVLENGRIIERGTHDDLIAEGKTYYQLYTGAFELE
ncbi:MAG: ABC transporter ATP-binding protein [Firmicutes bacterium]|nr:ABC transporter ATP-binding protein [Bacillota bacterium]